MPLYIIPSEQPSEIFFTRNPDDTRRTLDLRIHVAPCAAGSALPDPLWQNSMIRLERAQFVIDVFWGHLQLADTGWSLFLYDIMTSYLRRFYVQCSSCSRIFINDTNSLSSSQVELHYGAYTMKRMMSHFGDNERYYRSIIVSDSGSHASWWHCVQWIWS